MILSILILVSLSVVINGALLYFMISWRKSQALQMMYILEKQETLQRELVEFKQELSSMGTTFDTFEEFTRKKLSTVGTVLKIFEDETKILQKRNEQNALNQRFQRQPR